MAGQYGLKLGSAGMVSDTRAGIINADRMRGERKAKAQEALRKNGIPAALLFRPENIRYAASTMFLDFIDRLRYCLAFADHDPLIFMPGALPGRPLGGAYWIKPEQVRLSLHWAQQSPGPDAVRDTTRRFAEGIRDELKQKGLEKEKLGIDDIDEAGRQALVDAGLNLVNVMPVMLEARAVKTEDEINCIHMAAVLADAAHYAMYQAIKPGTRERDIKAVGTDTLLRLGAEEVGVVLVMSGGMIGGVSMGSDRIIQPGDVVTIDISRVSYLGYQTCFYRNYVVGRKPTEKEKDLHKKSYERMYTVLNAIKPGVSTADLAKHWVVATEKGFPSEEYMWCDDLAHGLGLWLYEYPIVNRLWSIDHPMTIEKGMTMAVEAMEFDPMVGRTKLEEMIVVTDSGVEIFTRMPVKDMMIASPITTAETE